MIDDDVCYHTNLVSEGEHSILSKETFDFLLDDNRSDKRSIDIEPGKRFDLSEGIVLLNAGAEIPAEIYSKVYYEIKHGYTLYHDYIAQCVYGRPYDRLTSDEQRNMGRLPIRIGEKSPYYEIRIIEDNVDIKKPKLRFSQDASEFD